MLEIEGPLGRLALHGCEKLLTDQTGKMSLEIPPYMSFKHNQDSRKASLEVENKGIRKQREMWGRFDARTLGNSF